MTLLRNVAYTANRTSQQDFRVVKWKCLPRRFVTVLLVWLGLAD